MHSGDKTTFLLRIHKDSLVTSDYLVPAFGLAVREDLSLIFSPEAMG